MQLGRFTPMISIATLTAVFIVAITFTTIGYVGLGEIFNALKALKAHPNINTPVNMDALCIDGQGCIPDFSITNCHALASTCTDLVEETTIAGILSANTQLQGTVMLAIRNNASFIASIRGEDGTNGTDGGIGPQGPNGIDANVLNAGIQGTTGPNGPPGEHGSFGTNGTDGPDGNPGADAIGAKGPDGDFEVGPQGVTTVGPIGVQGASIQGLQGASIEGPQGAPGPNNVLSTPSPCSCLDAATVNKCEFGDMWFNEDAKRLYYCRTGVDLWLSVDEHIIEFSQQESAECASQGNGVNEEQCWLTQFPMQGRSISVANSIYIEDARGRMQYVGVPCVGWQIRVIKRTLDGTANVGSSQLVAINPVTNQPIIFNPEVGVNMLYDGTNQGNFLFYINKLCPSDDNIESLSMWITYRHSIPGSV